MKKLYDLFIFLALVLVWKMTNKKENTSLKKEIRATFLDWAKESTFNGMQNLFNQNNLLVRILWLIFIFGSFIFCTIQILEMVKEYLKFEVKSKISLVDEVPSLFPIVSICNVNSLNTKYAVTYSQNLISKYASSTNNSLILDALNNPLVQRYLVQANIEISNETEKRMLGSFGYQLDKTILKCMYDNTICNFTDLEWYFDSNHGNCIKFNANQNKKVYDSELKSGLEMELYMGDDDEHVDFGITRGIRIYLSDSPIDSFVGYGIELPVSMSTNIEISKIITERLPKPYSKCRPLISDSDTYSQRICKQLCYQNDLVNSCSCYDTRFFNPKTNVKPCIEIKEILCSMKFRRNFLLNSTRQKCDLECPIECNTSKYDFKLSMANYPSERYVNYVIHSTHLSSLFVNKSISYEFLKNNLVAFKIFFNDLVNERIQDQPTFSENDLKANIGGALSLYVGISIVSLCQFIELLIKLIIVCFKKQKVKEKPEKVELSSF